MLYWISWVQPTNDYRPLAYPPHEAILGWWCSGYAEDGATLCAMVTAESETGDRPPTLRHNNGRSNASY
jgi:hypothetical protein